MSDREQVVQREIMDWLKAKGILHWRQHLGAVRVKGARIKNPMKGFPDIAGVMPGQAGQLFVIEVKKPDGRFSMEQVDWMNRLTAAGVVYVVATAVVDVAKAFALCHE
jgi:hypothetical protein